MNDFRKQRRLTFDKCKKNLFSIFLKYFLVIETAQKSRDGDLMALFDDPYELGHPSVSPSAPNKESSYSSGGTTASDENEEILNLETSPNKDLKKRNDNKPRRARTYHGMADSQSKKRIFYFI